MLDITTKCDLLGCLRERRRHDRAVTTSNVGAIDVGSASDGLGILDIGASSMRDKRRGCGAGLGNIRRGSLLGEVRVRGGSRSRNLDGLNILLGRRDGYCLLLLLGDHTLLGNTHSPLLHDRTGNADFALLLDNAGDHNGLVDLILLGNLDSASNLNRDHLGLKDFLRNLDGLGLLDRLRHLDRLGDSDVLALVVELRPSLLDLAGLELRGNRGGSLIHSLNRSLLDLVDRLGRSLLNLVHGLRGGGGSVPQNLLGANQMLLGASNRLRANDVLLGGERLGGERLPSVGRRQVRGRRRSWVHRVDRV
mmetsp:Transcript_84879/g.226476  ORF Transcript_84879/g.226476 Transcript_84879/m.226476 type:complete len:307 (-) Transcript_84879:46-966(-)